MNWTKTTDGLPLPKLPIIMWTKDNRCFAGYLREITNNPFLKKQLRFKVLLPADIAFKNLLIEDVIYWSYLSEAKKPFDNTTVKTMRERYKRYVPSIIMKAMKI